MNDPNELLELDRLLAAANPVGDDEIPEASAPAAAPLYERTVARLRKRRHVRRRMLAVAVAGAALLVGGGAIAAVTGAPWWSDAEPPANPEVVDRQLARGDTSFPPAADRARARTVARANGAALVAAPVGQDGYCLIPSLPADPDLGHSCVYQLSDELRSYARPAGRGEPRWIVYGRITDVRARTLDLSEAAGVPFRIELRRGGFFLADVPSERWQALGNTAGRGRILDGSGETLRAGCVNWGASPLDAGAGTARFGFWSETPGPCVARPRPLRPPAPIVERAEKLVETTLEQEHGLWPAGTTIAIWRAPTREGGECVYTGLAEPESGERAMSGGGTCSYGPTRRPPLAMPIVIGRSSTREGRDRYAVLINGEVRDVFRVTRVALRTPAGEREVAYGSGFFLAQLPGVAPSADEFPPGGPYTIVAYDALGNEIATRRLQTLAEQIAEQQDG